MHEQLADIVKGFETARARLQRLTANILPEKFTVRNDIGRWSAGECIGHLNITSRAYVTLLNNAFAQHAKPARSPTHYRRDAAGWFIGKLAGPMPRIGSFRFGRTPTVPAFIPDRSAGREALLADFETLQNEQIALVKTAEGHALENIQIASPFNARLKYNAFSCLVLLPQHQHRHLEQAENVWPQAAERDG